MSDLHPLSIFFLIFSAMLLLYGNSMARTGDITLMPYHTAHSIRNSEDVKHVGMIVRIIALVIGAASLALFIISR